MDTVWLSTHSRTMGVFNRPQRKCAGSLSLNPAIVHLVVWHIRSRAHYWHRRTSCNCRVEVGGHFRPHHFPRLKGIVAHVVHAIKRSALHLTPVRGTRFQQRLVCCKPRLGLHQGNAIHGDFAGSVIGFVDANIGHEGVQPFIDSIRGV